VARVPSHDALAVLETALASDSADERRQAAVALGGFGSYLGWQARGPEQAKLGDALRSEAASKLVSALKTGSPAIPSDALIDSIATIAHPDSKAQLEAAAADKTLGETARALAKQALDRLDASLARQR